MEYSLMRYCKKKESIITAPAIISSIERIINGKYSDWSIGVTGNPNKRFKELKKPKDWRQWDAGNEKDAANDARYFWFRGCNGVPDQPGDKNLRFVYIFLSKTE